MRFAYGRRCSCTVADDYGCGESFSDVLRQIALDERQHKLESLEELEALADHGRTLVGSRRP